MTYAIEADDDVRYLDGRIAEWPFGVTPSAEKRGLPLSRVPGFARTLCRGSTLLLRRGAGFASNA